VRKKNSIDFVVPKQLTLTISSTPHVPCPEQPLGHEASEKPSKRSGKIKNDFIVFNKASFWNPSFVKDFTLVTRE